MSSFRIRPRFSQTVDLELEKLQAQIVSRVEDEIGRPAGSRVEVKTSRAM